MILPTKKIWKTGKPSEDLVKNITDILDCHPLTAKLLVNRSIYNLESIKDFFSSDLKGITPPWKIRDIEKACSRIYNAIINNERILIFGDYDTDGITSTSILYLFLKPYLKNISYFIPNRQRDGYGFSKKHVKLMLEKRIKLIITVDCGSSNQEAIAEAKKNNIDTIVTDHHKIPSIPKSALAVVNPHRKDCNSKLTHLAGAGVAFYLTIQLRKTMRDNNFFINRPEPNLSSFLDLVALGTIADIVPMVKENRVFTKSGINLIRKNPRKSLKRMCRDSGIDHSHLGSQDIGFSISPRLNSAGRIDDANKCVELLCSENDPLIIKISSFLNSLNSKRKEMEDKIVSQIKSNISPGDLTGKIIISHSESWSPGILGTAAAKISRQFNLPCILLTKEDSTLKGSARSIDGLSIFDILNMNREYLQSFGGHSQAAGLSLNYKDLNLFLDSIRTSIKKNISDDLFTPVHEAEDVVVFDELSDTFLNEMELFEPFGVFNPYPLFISKNIIVENHRRLKDIHSMVTLYQPNCVLQNRLTGFVFNNDNRIPSHLNQILLKPVPDKRNRKKPNIFIEAWQ